MKGGRSHLNEWTRRQRVWCASEEDCKEVWCSWMDNGSVMRTS